MQTILDHTQDLAGSEQHRLTSLYTPPAFVKEANHDQLYGEPDTLPPHVYAHVRNRLYPCHTKSATWMSCLFFNDKRREFHPEIAGQIEQRLMKSAEYWHIKPDVEALFAKMAEDESNGVERLPDNCFALVWTSEAGKERHYPLRNAHEVKLASTWFGKYRDEFAFLDRQQIASKILDKADEFGAAVDDRELLNKTAGYGACSASEIAECWEKRANLTCRSFPDYAAEARKVAGVVRSAPPEARDHNVRVKMAALMDQFDRETKLNRLYGEGGLARPEEVLFQVTEKQAADFLQDHLSTTTGSIYEKQALEAITLENIRHWLGNDLAEEVTSGGVYVDQEKLADLVITLPRPDAEMFDRMAAQLHIPVFAREKAAHDKGMSVEEMRALAAEYEQQGVLEPSGSIL